MAVFPAIVRFWTREARAVPRSTTEIIAFRKPCSCSGEMSITAVALLAGCTTWGTRIRPSAAASI